MITPRIRKRVLDSAHDDLDQYQFGVTRKIINDRAPKANSNDMWS